MTEPEAGLPGERLDLDVPADLAGVEVLVAENCARRWEVLHHTYTVCTILDLGHPAEWRYRNQLNYLEPDTVGLMEPGEVHANTHVTDPASFRVLFMGPDVVKRAAQELDMAGIPHFKSAQISGETHPEVLHAAREFHACMEHSSTSLEIQSKFASYLQLLLDHCAEETPRPAQSQLGHPAIQRARDFIHEHVSDPIKLQDVVEAAGTSNQFQLIRDFSAAVGLPPHAYQIQLRVIKARSLLAAAVRPADVAAELGFADQSHLSRHFTRAVGVGPGAYARATAGAKTFKTFAG